MSQTKILFIGDVCGDLGLDIVNRVLPSLKNTHNVDLVIANGENGAYGRGVTREVIERLVQSGVDVVMGGDHTFAIKGFADDLNGSDLPFVRPANYEAPDLPGVGYRIVDLGEKGKIAIMSVLGTELFTFNHKVHNPFWFIDELLQVPEIRDADIKFIDFHAEATSEKLSFAWYVKDRVQTVVGTHTHVSTADNRLLGGRVAYVTDVGQVGPYEASLWVDFASAIHGFKYPTRVPFEAEKKAPYIFNSVLVTYENFSPVKIERTDVVIESSLD